MSKSVAPQPPREPNTTVMLALPQCSLSTWLIIMPGKGLNLEPLICIESFNSNGKQCCIFRFAEEGKLRKLKHLESPSIIMPASYIFILCVICTKKFVKCRRHILDKHYYLKFKTKKVVKYNMTGCRENVEEILDKYFKFQ